MIHKKISVLLSTLALTTMVYAQQTPTGTPGNSSDWRRGGNLAAPPGLGGTNNIFGAMWNSPIYTVTNGLNRTKLNGTFSYMVNGNLQPRDGFMLIGPNAVGSSNTNSFIYPDRGAFSLLHLNGTGVIQEFGFRSWMRTGITLTDNQDMSYIGLRQVGTGVDITEMVINWTDNQGGGNFGPDDMVFRFTSGGAGNPVINNTDYRQTVDLDGLHIARFTAGGLMGLGNTFGVNAPLAGTTYNRPQSLLHMSYDHAAGAVNEPFGFMQITYRRPLNNTVDIIGQGEQATDGLRLGIDNDIFGAAPQTHLNGYLRWQEASSFVIQTEDSRIPSIQTNERFRVTSIGALVRNYNGALYTGLNANLGDANPFNDSINDNVTRISISELGSQSLTRPKSLLHLGYDYGNFNLVTPPEGYRRWMDLGMLTSNNEDHVWIGLKPKDSLSQFVTATNDRLDAVVAWGTDRTANNIDDIDNMRFIFTGITAGLNGSLDNNQVPSRQYDGLEMMRMYPATVYQHYLYDANGNIDDSLQSYGRVGIGDFTASGVNQMPTHKLDVVGNGRFRYLPDSLYMADSLVTKIVMVDSLGVLRWKSFVPSEFGTYCGDTVNGKLNANKKVVLNNYKLYFTNEPDSMILGENRMGLGYECGDSLPGKLSVWQKHDTLVHVNTVAGHFLNSDTASNPQIITKLYGVWGEASGLQPTNLKTMNFGGSFYARSAQVNYGVRGIAEYGGLGNPNSIGVQNIGGQFEGSFGSQTATGVVAQGTMAKLRNIGVSGNGTSPTVPSQIENIGGQFAGAYSANDNIGVKAVGFNGNHAYGVLASASGGTFNHAGYFAGPVEATAYITNPSDQQFKTDITSLNGSLKTLTTGLKPVSFYMDTTNFSQFNFDSNLQFGFVAQQVANTFPNLIHESEFPAQYDSLGNEISPAVSYKSLNYNGLIPINTQAIIELNQKVDKATLSDETIKTNVQDLSGSLDKVLNMRGVSYDWNHAVHPELNLDSANHVGFIAQEMAQIDARLTYLADDSLLHIEYDKVVPILAEAIQELNDSIGSRDSIISVLVNQNAAQQTTINDLNNRLTNLENCLSALLPSLCQMNQSLIQNNTPAQQEEVRAQLSVRLANKEAIILDQNVPNPFAEQTVINFSIPATVQKAQIHFYDSNGKIIQSVDVVERGLGSLTVFGADLSTGIYTYTLVADGQIVATKRMMKE